IPYGVVGFDTFNAKSGQDLIDGGANAVHQTTGGTLVLPDGASPANKVPAMVILHGSGGDWSGRSVNLAMSLAREGIAGLAVDTFTARNLRSTDDYLERLEKAPIYTQMADALSALLALQEHPSIDTSRIGVTGFSLGAGSTLYMMFEPVIEGTLGKDGPRFSAYAMFYGGCMVDFDDFRVEGSPALIMMGEADESMSIPACEKFRDRLRSMGVDVELVVYPGAGHGWDNPYPQQFSADKVVTRDCLMHWGANGEIVEMTSGNSMDSAMGAMRAMSDCSSRDGYTMGRNEAALEQSFADLLEFLQQTWSL
ncbi:MAG: dienelactone hydrolase family protein, partial [Gammaproteobacteria bacterium]|nr:dienelactone hydrolase family protein [Gammaproteobacteria bacterium]